MAKDERPRDLMGYEALQQNALRGVIRAGLERALSPGGLPGEHHFYISFRTDAADVSIPPDLKARYPEEMTIVLQHQFWDLTIGEKAFSVTLQFNGMPKSLSIPFAAVSRFYDPSIHYLLQFTVEPAPAAPASSPASNGSAPRPAGGPASVDGPKVVSLDQFRKK